ncbi:MAG: hypothetical protein EBS89_09395 [Proteobacteria bacterium]|nr:hypothetical protein [Pseudomonadota bacterium]
MVWHFFNIFTINNIMFWEWVSDSMFCFFGYFIMTLNRKLFFICIRSSCRLTESSWSFCRLFIFFNKFTFWLVRIILLILFQ